MDHSFSSPSSRISSSPVVREVVNVLPTGRITVIVTLLGEAME